MGMIVDHDHRSFVIGSMYYFMHEIMEKLINKCICFCDNFLNHNNQDKLDYHELQNININTYTDGRFLTH